MFFEHLYYQKHKPLHLHLSWRVDTCKIQTLRGYIGISKIQTFLRISFTLKYITTTLISNIYAIWCFLIFFLSPNTLKIIMTQCIHITTICKHDKLTIYWFEIAMLEYLCILLHHTSIWFTSSFSFHNSVHNAGWHDTIAIL